MGVSRSLGKKIDKMFWKLTSTAVTLALLAALISVSPAVGGRKWRKRISSEVGPATLNISYENPACTFDTTGITINETNPYKFTQILQCGNITVEGQSTELGTCIPYNGPQKNL